MTTTDRRPMRPRQLSEAQVFALDARRIANDLTRHQRANQRALTLLDKARTSIEMDCPDDALKIVTRAMRLLYSAEPATTGDPA